MGRPVLRRTLATTNRIRLQRFVNMVRTHAWASHREWRLRRDVPRHPTRSDSAEHTENCGYFNDLKLMPKMFRTLYLILLFMTAPLSCFAQSDPPCWSAKTAEEFENCLAIERSQRGNELENLYKKALTLLEASDPVPAVGFFPEHVKSTIVQAQNNWKKFVETDCEAVFARTAPGRSASTEQDRCWITHIKRRIQDLQEWSY